MSIKYPDMSQFVVTARPNRTVSRNHYYVSRTAGPDIRVSLDTAKRLIRQGAQTVNIGGK